MAELNVTGPEDPNATRRVDPQHRLPESTDAPPEGTIAKVDDPELARLQIEQTRARMSETIDQIEGELLRKKEKILRTKEDIEEKMDVLAPARRTARENPLPTVGGIFLVGLVLGWLTGGSDEDDGPEPAVRRFAPDFDRERTYVDHWEERANTWEQRARRLMSVASELEDELMRTRGETVPVRRRRRRLFRRGPRSATREADGMPLRPRADGETGYGRDPLPAPI